MFRLWNVGYKVNKIVSIINSSEELLWNENVRKRGLYWMKMCNVVYVYFNSQQLVLFHLELVNVFSIVFFLHYTVCSCCMQTLEII